MVACVFACAVSAWAAAPDGRRPLLVTVDDLPLQGPVGARGDAEAVNRGLLRALAAHHVPAVGFVVWDRVTTDADRRVLDAWLAGGHELGSHSASHPDYTRTEIPAYLDDVERARVALSAYLGASGRTLRFFRFPFLDEGDTPEKLTRMREALAAHAITNLPVTIDTQDWSFTAPWVEATDRAARAAVAEAYHEALHVSVRHHEAHGDDLFDRTTPQILLLHANAIGADQWDRLFGWLEDTGHRFAAADEVLADPALADPPAFVFRHGTSLWARIDHARESAAVDADVRKLLADQTDAWNRGDLDAFCSVYADDALFLSPSGTHRGREAVRARYAARYPTQTDMGTLSLEVVELRPVWGPERSMLDDSVPSRIHAVTVAARWTLDRATGPLTGGTLLTLHRSGRTWTIEQDASF